MSNEKIAAHILGLQYLSPQAKALQECFRDFDMAHRGIVIGEIRRIMGNFDFVSNFGIVCALELLAIYIAYKNGWRDFRKEGYGNAKNLYGLFSRCRVIRGSSIDIRS